MKWNIIKKFSSSNTLGFTLQDVSKEFPEKSRIHLTRVLGDMVEQGMLSKISRGIYHIIPLHADPATYVPNGHQVAKYIMQDKEYYFGYASALNIHGLELQSKAKVFVVTKKQIKPAIRYFRDIQVQFIQHEKSRFFGFSKIWINQFEEAMVSDLEKTIVDVCTKPHLCSGIIEVGNAIYQAKNRTDHEKLFYYLARNVNKSAKKRFLYLSEILGMEWTNDHERMMEELGTGISLLDPAAPDQGKKGKKFGLKINVDPILITKKVLHH